MLQGESSFHHITQKINIANSIHIKGIGKQCDILFDCGMLDEEMLSAKHIFVTHGHTDHIGACISHARGISEVSRFVIFILLQPEA